MVLEPHSLIDASRHPHPHPSPPLEGEGMAPSLLLAVIEFLAFNISLFLRKNHAAHDQCKSSPSRGGFRWGWGCFNAFALNQT